MTPTRIDPGDPITRCVNCEAAGQMTYYFYDDPPWTCGACGKRGGEEIVDHCRIFTEERAQDLLDIEFRMRGLEK